MPTESSHAGSGLPEEHPLDNPVWMALTSAQAGLAEGGPLARRYPTALAPFAAMGDATPSAYRALAALIPRGSQVALLRPQRLTPPSGLEVAGTFPLLQMIVAEQRFGPDEAAGLVELGAADGPDMMRLTELTRPGPFANRTHELGRYVGIRARGELVAMAGERIRFDHHVEISAVCVHPDHRGRGHAQRLVSALARMAIREGSTPFLHVFADNAPALAVYERLGFAVRRTMQVTRLRTAADPAS